MRISDWSSDVCSSDLLVLEAVDDLGAVEAEVFGVAAHEADGIGRPGQVLVLAALYGVEIGVADAQHLGDGPEVLAELLARPDEGVGDRFAGHFLRDGNLRRTLGMHQLRLTEPRTLTQARRASLRGRERKVMDIEGGGRCLK